MKKPARYIVFATIIFLIFGILFAVFAHDHEKNHSHQEGLQKHGHDNHHHSNHLQPITNQTYKEKCGACHFAYQPELLPSSSWSSILGNLAKHFGESVDVDGESKKIIEKYLIANASEHSNAKRAVKITKSLGGKTPSRITEIPYIRHKHHEISSEVLGRKAIGSLSNCSACHRTAEQGIYDDDNVLIPK